MPVLTQSADDAWKQIGKDDPYFGVLSHDQFHRQRLDDEARREFFASGERHVERLLSVMRRQFGEGTRLRRVLDFGCGVGRVVIPLTDHAAEVVGVDVSEAMLEEARRNCADRGVDNARFVLSDPTLSALDGTFDLVHSYIVLQHIPIAQGLAFIRELVRRLEPRGLGALHITYGNDLPGWKQLIQSMRASVPLVNGIVNVLKGRRFSTPLRQMNSYDVNAVLDLLRSSGCGNLTVHLTDHGGYYGAILFFRKGEDLAYF